MPYADVNDIRMYYEELGDPSLPPLILMHGASGAIDVPGGGWTDHMPAFAEHYRAIHVEHRGHGRTNNPAGKLRYETIADDVVRFIGQKALGPAHIAGVSDGGITALVIGMTRPDVARALVARAFPAVGRESRRLPRLYEGRPGPHTESDAAHCRGR